MKTGGADRLKPTNGCSDIVNVNKGVKRKTKMGK